MTITKAQYADYQRLKEAERTGHLLSEDALCLIVKACDYDPEKVGKHFLEVYAGWRSERKRV